MVERRFDRLSRHSVEQLYNLALDIASYPKFLPWCSAARIIKEDESIIIADLVISFSGFREKYRSKVKKFPYNENQNQASIIVELIDGPFEFLQNEWHFSKISDGMTKVDFYINFKFNSAFLDKLVGIVFEKAMAKMIESFENRANEIYGN